MKIKFTIIFILAIIIPTSLLAYFGLLAVRSEKSIVEKSMRQKYEAIADIVEGEIKKTLEGAQKELLENPKYQEHMVLEAASLFRDEAVILDNSGKALDEGKAAVGKPVIVRRLKDLPYEIAVYERYPVLLTKFEEKRHNLSLYIGIIYLSALLILSGAFVTLWALSRQWKMAQLRNEFAQHISHELKRPLTSIRMFSEMLKTGRVPDAQKRSEYYNIIFGESEKLTYLVNNVLDFARVEMGRKGFNMERKDLARVVTETVDRFRTYIIGEPRPVLLDIKEDIPPLKIDEGALSQAIMNLLINAAKYSSVGTEIKVNVGRTEDEAVIDVIDQGIGISRKEQNKIFNRFYRTSRKEISETEGSGLGLPLVKYIADAHGGEVRVESEEGRGSRFSLIIPIS